MEGFPYGLLQWMHNAQIKTASNGISVTWKQMGQCLGRRWRAGKKERANEYTLENYVSVTSVILCIWYHNEICHFLTLAKIIINKMVSSQWLLGHPYIESS